MINSETKRVGKFGAIGILNTLIDFVIYNLFINLVGLAAIPANIISTSCAMLFSFIANKNFVFQSKERNLLLQAALFLSVTMFGLYVLQNGIIYFLHEVWTWPLDFAYEIVELVKLDSLFSREFTFNNGAKGIATIFSLTWNYLTYKRFVFKK